MIELFDEEHDVGDVDRPGGARVGHRLRSSSLGRRCDLLSLVADARPAANRVHLSLAIGGIGRLICIPRVVEVLGVEPRAAIWPIAFHCGRKPALRLLCADGVGEHAGATRGLRKE